MIHVFVLMLILSVDPGVLFLQAHYPQLPGVDAARRMSYHFWRIPTESVDENNQPLAEFEGDSPQFGGVRIIRTQDGKLRKLIRDIDRDSYIWWHAGRLNDPRYLDEWENLRFDSLIWLLKEIGPKRLFRGDLPAYDRWFTK